MRLIDLSHPLVSGTPNFLGDPQIRLRPHHAMPSAPCNVTELTLSSHQGTHADAPRHFFREGKGIDEIALERFCGPAVLVDFSPGSALPPGSILDVAQFEPFAAAFTPGARVIYRTGWDRRFGGEQFFRDFPSLTPAAARWLAAKRIGLIGMDTPTPGTDFVACHHALLGPGAEIVILEGLTGLERLPSHFRLIAFPLRISEGDGAPVRAVAWLD